MSKLAEEIAYEAEASGVSPGTPAFDMKLRELRVLKCRELQGVLICSSCRAYLDCELIKHHLRDVAYGGPNGSSS